MDGMKNIKHHGTKAPRKMLKAEDFIGFDDSDGMPNFIEKKRNIIIGIKRPTNIKHTSNQFTRKKYPTRASKMTKIEISSERVFEDVKEASFLNLMTGEHFIFVDGQDFLIGNAKVCSLVIEDVYISNLQCSIVYKNKSFVIYNHSSSPGTFLNCERVHENDGSRVLKDGDIIAFGEEKNMKYIYKFVLVAMSEGKLELEKKEAIENLTEKNEQLKSIITELFSTVKKLNTDHKNLKKNMQTEIVGYGNEIAKVTSTVKTLLTNLEIKKYCVDSLKSQIHGLVENVFDCIICTGTMVKATIMSDCGHLFCKKCITEWFKIKQTCPLCNSFILFTSNSLIVDNFLDEIRELLGGAIKERRAEKKIENAPIPEREEREVDNNNPYIDPLYMDVVDLTYD